MTSFSRPAVPPSPLHPGLEAEYRPREPVPRLRRARAPPPHGEHVLPAGALLARGRRAREDVRLTV